MAKKQIFSDPRLAYKKMIFDIRKAKREILLETYIYSDDSVGRQFRQELTKKASEGVRVRLLLDSWGSKVRKKYFKELIEFGGEVRFFRALRYTWSPFTDNHERNHRKLLVVDGKVSYIGSLNITARCLNWIELSLRIEGPLSLALRRSFNRSWKRFNLFSKRRMKKILHEGFEIIHDFPSFIEGSPLEKSYKKLLRNAREEILIETPYFLPSIGIRREIKNAIKRGVKVVLILPRQSDVLFADILRGRSLGPLHDDGVQIYYYPRMLHSKLLIVDKTFFLLGSSNLDYRSFLHQYEVNLLGKDQELIGMLKKYYNSNLNCSTRFSYGAWKNRRRFRKILERVLYRFREYF